jgi:hypothetical protein
MSNVSFNKNLGKLKFPQFEKWFKKNTKRSELDAKKIYVQLGGKLDEPKAKKPE